MFPLMLCDNKHVFLYVVHPILFLSFSFLPPKNKTLETQSTSIIRCKEKKASYSAGAIRKDWA
jgi:hypothetical protein